jgi:DNA topoisomerase II
MKRTYEKLSHVEHILKRPDTYVGSMAREPVRCWNEQRVVSPALVKIFDEVLVNAIDQWSLNPKRVKRIGVECAGVGVSVWNDGVSIPIERHETENLWIPEMLFGHLLTSSNYDDTEGPRDRRPQRLRRQARERLL